MKQKACCKCGCGLISTGRTGWYLDHWKKGRKVWNKGLTMQTDERVRMNVEKSKLTKRERSKLGIYKKPPKEIKLNDCLCGCGQKVKNKYVHNHHCKGDNNVSRRPDIREKRRQQMIRLHQEGKIPPIWCTGLTKETDERIAKYSKERSENFIQEERDKLSIKMKQQWEDGRIVPLTKSNHPQWKGGTSELIAMIRGSWKMYKEWKYPILQKFEFKCSLCGSTKKLEVHHDKEKMCDIFKNFLLESKKELNFEEKGKICDQVIQYHIDNKISGIVLCKECHKKAHNKI